MKTTTTTTQDTQTTKIWKTEEIKLLTPEKLRAVARTK